MTVSKASPASFNPSQEMIHKTLELRYQLDTEFPHVDFHAHPFYEIYYFLEGPLERYVVGGKSYRLQPGDVLMIPPGIPHLPIFSMESKPYRRYVLWLSGEQIEHMTHLDPSLMNVFQLCQQQKTYRIRSSTPAAGRGLEYYLDVMWQEEKNMFSCKTASLYSLCINFIVLLNRIIADEYALMPKQPQSENLLEMVLTYIHENYAEDISLNTVANHFFTSSSNIEYLMRRKLGKPFYRYVTECRIIHSQVLIFSGMPLKEVSIACGYSDYSSFFRAFSKEVGVSPNKFRHNCHPDHFGSTKKLM